MKKVLVVLAVLALATVAGAQELVVNGTFDTDLSGWTASGVSWSNGNFGIPASPASGHGEVAMITSWGGNWGGPMGTIEQSIGLDGPGTLSGYLFAGAHAGDAWRNCGVNVLWNGEQVATLWRDADPNKWAGDFTWEPFSVEVTGSGVNTLKLEFYAHFAEWTWTAADDLSVVPVPEPSSILALSTGLIGLAGFAIRRRK